MNIDAKQLRSKLNVSDHRQLLNECGFNISSQAGPALSGVLGPQELGEGENGNFSVDLRDGLVKDFGSSGYEGDVFEVVMDVQGLQFSEALEWIANRLNLSKQILTMPPPQNGRRGRPSTTDDSHQESVISPDTVSDWHDRLMSNSGEARAARTYLTGERGLAQEVLKAAQIGLAFKPNNPLARWWITIPIPAPGGESFRVDALKKFAFNPDGPYWKRNEDEDKIPRNTGPATLYDPVSMGGTSKDSQVVVCEGELDALCAFSNGFNAVTGNAGVNTFKEEWATRLSSLAPAQEYGVVLAFDGDKPGRKWAPRHAETLEKAGLDVRIASLPDGQDVNDILVSNGKNAFRAILESASLYSSSDNTSPTVGTLASDVQTERVDWLWKPWLPIGELTVLDGDPGLGKSTLTCELAARFTNGESMPDSDHSPAPCGVVMVGAEDSPSRTIRPRLEAAGADLQHICLVPNVPTEEGHKRPVVLPNDLDLLSKAVRRVDARFLVVDPLMAHLAEGVNAHRDQDVRRALTPLSTFAEEENVAVLVIRHLNKSSGNEALYRGGGSIGIIGQARVGWLIGTDPADESRCVIATTKNNLSVDPQPRGFRLEEATEHEVARVKWDGVASVTTTDLLETPDDQGRPPTQRKQAKTWLRSKLANGPVESTKLKEEASEEGITKSTLERAKDRLPVEVSKKGFDSGWIWELAQENR